MVKRYHTNTPFYYVYDLTTAGTAGVGGGGDPATRVGGPQQGRQAPGSVCGAGAALGKEDPSQ